MQRLMRFLIVAFALMATSNFGFQPPLVNATNPELASIVGEFENYTKTRLVFDQRDLPDGRYFDVLMPLDEKRRIGAAKICLREARKLPPGYLGESGLDAIGVFAACVNKTGDGFRRYDKRLKGYRYLGVYNGSNAVAAAYYGDGQLPLTFHHEIFHHVDSTVHGKTERWQLSSDDAVYQAAISGVRRYETPPIDSDDRTHLDQASGGEVLHDVVSLYAAKNLREDQAEAARYLMSELPDAVLQTFRSPELAGSQRILHVLKEYENAVEDGPTMDWFIDAALRESAMVCSDSLSRKKIDQTIARLERFAEPEWMTDGDTKAIAEARGALKDVCRLDMEDLTTAKSEHLIWFGMQLPAA